MHKGNKVLVTGASGNVGQPLIHLLGSHGCSYLAGSTNPNKLATGQFGESHYLNFQDPTTFTMTDFDRVFLMRPPQIANIERDMRPFVEWLKANQVRQVVVLSLMGAERMPWVPHRKLELLLEKLQVPSTFLRPGFFMQNISGIHAYEIKTRDELLVPAGTARMSFIDARDIAEAAFQCLQDPDTHVGKSYTLTGQQALDYDQVADMLSNALGRNIHYRRPSIVRFALSMTKRGIPWPMIAVMTGLYLGSRIGRPDAVTDDLPKLLGRKPTSFVEFISSHLSAWTSGGA